MQDMSSTQFDAFLAILAELIKAKAETVEEAAAIVLEARTSAK